MMNDKFKDIISGTASAQETLRRAVSPSSAIDRLTSESAGMRSVKRVSELSGRFQDFGRTSELQHILGQANSIRTLLGPLDDLNALAVKAIGPTEALTKLARTAQDYLARFSLPDDTAVQALLKASNQISTTAELFQRHDESFLRSIKAMHEPWLNRDRTLQSFNGFRALQSLGATLTNFPGYDDQVSEAIRNSLGDWREAMTFPANVFEDFKARSDLYVTRGFDVQLSEFPVDAFVQGMEIAQLRNPLPEVLAAYQADDNISAELDEQEEGFRRTNRAHDRLMRMETHLRQFIDTLMTTAFGSDWPRTRLPNNLYNLWLDKKRRAELESGTSHPIVSYADFNDYMLIINKSDNWPVFSPYFVRIESARETFQRLGPLRIATMHSRLISQDDEVYLDVELKRLFSAMRSMRG